MINLLHREINNSIKITIIRHTIKGNHSLFTQDTIIFKNSRININHNLTIIKHNLCTTLIQFNQIHILPKIQVLNLKNLCSKEIITMLTSAIITTPSSTVIKYPHKIIKKCPLQVVLIIWIFQTEYPSKERKLFVDNLTMLQKWFKE